MLNSGIRNVKIRIVKKAENNKLNENGSTVHQKTFNFIYFNFNSKILIRELFFIKGL